MNNKQNKIIKAIASKSPKNLIEILDKDPCVANETIKLVTVHTPLSFAIISGKDDMALSLINAGANIDGDKKLNKIPLHIACSMGNSSMVSLLLENKADANALDSMGNNALFYLLNYVRLDDTDKVDTDKDIVSIVSKLIECGINKNQKNKKNVSIIDVIDKIYLKSSNLRDKGLKIKKALNAKDNGKDDVKRNQHNPYVVKK